MVSFDDDYNVYRMKRKLDKVIYNNHIGNFYECEKKIIHQYNTYENNKMGGGSGAMDDAEYGNLESPNILSEITPIPTNSGKKKMKEGESKLDQLVAQEEEDRRQKRIKQVTSALNEMKGHLAVEEAFIKELVQNAIDAKSTRIDISFDYDTKSEIGTIQVKDNGSGMNYDIIRNQLLTLFESGKEEDITKIGRFGVGFVSVFAPESLEEVVVDTNTGDEEFRVSLLPPKHGWEGTVSQVEGEVNPEEKGTTVSMHLKYKAAQRFANYAERVKAELDKSCAFSKTPLYVEGEKINREFKIPHSDFQIPLNAGGSELEGYIGFRKDRRPVSGFFNRRLLVSLNEQPIFADHPEISVYVSSSLIDYNISRDGVIENKHYKMILRSITDALPRLYNNITSKLEHNQQYAIKTIKQESNSFWANKPSQYKAIRFVGDEVLFNEMFNYFSSLNKKKAEKYLSTQKKLIMRLSKKNRIEYKLSNIPIKIRKAKIFSGLTWNKEKDEAEWKRVSIDEVISQNINKGQILADDFTTSTSISRIAKALMKRGHVIMPDMSNWKNPQKKVLELFMDYSLADAHYDIPEYEETSTLPQNVQDFIHNLEELIEESPLSRYISSAVMGNDYSRQHKDKSLYIDDPYQANRKGTLTKKLYKTQLKGFKRIKSSILQKQILSLNKNNDYIQQAIKTMDDPKVGFEAYLGILWSVAIALRNRSHNMPNKFMNYVATHDRFKDIRGQGTALEINEYEKKELLLKGDLDE